MYLCVCACGLRPTLCAYACMRGETGGGAGRDRGGEIEEER